MSGTKLDLQNSIGLTVGNTVTVTAADASAFAASFLTNLGGGNYTIDPTTGSIIDNFWNGTFGSPAPSDLTSFQLTIADASQNVVTFVGIHQNGQKDPAIGVEALAVNGLGVVAEQIDGYFPGADASYVSSHLNPNQFYVFSKIDMSVTEPGYGGPSAGDLTFSPTICFASGTRIATPAGDVAVEDLRPGDTVTLAGGGELAVVWIGEKLIDLRHHADPDSIMPIRIAPGAFGDLLPKRPLLLSPEHAVFVDEVLIPIRHLVNGSSICQIDCDSITYHHVELERHAVLLAEGLPAESYLDVGDRGWFDNGRDTSRDHDVPVAAVREALSCAPFVVTGERLEAIQRRLDERALLPSTRPPVWMEALIRRGGLNRHHDIAKA